MSDSLNKTSEKNLDIYGYLTVLSVILVSGSLYYATYYRTLLLIPLFIILASWVFLKNKFRFNFKYFLYIFVFMGGSLLNINNVDFESYLSMFLRFSIALIVVSTISVYQFSLIYVKLMKWICLISLLYIPIIIFKVKSILPPLRTLAGELSHPYDNYIFFAINTGVDNFRNLGIFAEPGMYQFFIGLALLFGIIFKHLTIRSFFILLITLISTQSTSAYLSGGIIVLLYAYEYKVFSNKNTKQQFYSLLVLTVLVAIAIPFMQTVVVEKFSEDNKSYGSMAARYEDNLIDLRLFLENPLTGIGFGNYEYKKIIGKNYEFYNADVNSLAVVFGQIGILALYLVYPLVLPAYTSYLKIFSRLMCMVVLIIIFSSQNLFMYLIFNVTALYGLEKKWLFPYRVCKPKKIQSLSQFPEL